MLPPRIQQTEPLRSIEHVHKVHAVLVNDIRGMAQLDWQSRQEILCRQHAKLG